MLPDSERDGSMPFLLTDNLEAIRAIGREFGVVRLEIFGSACSNAFDPDQSDVDFLVEFPP